MGSAAKPKVPTATRRTATPEVEPVTANGEVRQTIPGFRFPSITDAIVRRTPERGATHAATPIGKEPGWQPRTGPAKGEVPKKKFRVGGGYGDTFLTGSRGILTGG